MNNNQFGMNSTNNQMNSNNYNQPTPNQNMNSFNQQPVPNNISKKNNKTILIIGAIAIGVIVVAILLFSIFNGSSKNASIYVHDAKSIVNGTKALVDSEVTSNLFGSDNRKYAPICTYNNQNNESIITLDTIINERALSNEDDFDYYLSSSFVKVKATYNNGCNYEYYIYLTDGKYSIGTPSNPILIDNVTNKSVTK